MSRWFVLGAVLVGAGLFGAGCGPVRDYSYCVTNRDCESNVCAQTTVVTTTGRTISGHQCTRPCSVSSECGSRNSYNAACLMIAGTATAFYCYQGCAYDYDCPGTGICTPVTGGAVGSVCFPSD